MMSQDSRVLAIASVVASVVARSAKGRDAESAEVAEVRWACVIACVVVLGDTPALVVGG